jgi:membrane protease YdiL (CAAX protease family)
MLRNIFTSPDENRPRAGWRIFFQFILMGFTLAFVLFFLKSLGSANPILAFLGDDFLISAIAITLSILLARRWLDKRSFRSLGISLDDAATRDLLFGIFMPALLMALVLLVQWALGWLNFEGFAWNFPDFDPMLIGYWGFGFILVGWYEELLSRGYWMQNLAEGLGMPLAVFISSAIFSLMHLANPSASIASVLGILAAGYFLAYPYLRTGSLWLSIGLHIGWNFFQGPIFGFPVSGLESTGLLIHSESGPDLLTGGPFGPEAGLIVLPTLALGAYFVFLFTKNRKPISPEEIA